VFASSHLENCEAPAFLNDAFLGMDYNNIKDNNIVLRAMCNEQNS